MSIVSGLDNGTLLSLLSEALGASSSSSEESATSGSTSSMDLPDTVTLTNKDSLLQSLTASLSSDDKS
jgi:hypothetical protein